MPTSDSLSTGKLLAVILPGAHTETFIKDAGPTYGQDACSYAIA